MGNTCGSTIYFSLGEGHSRRPFLSVFWKGRGIRNCWNTESTIFFPLVKGGWKCGDKEQTCNLDQPPILEVINKL